MNNYEDIFSQELKEMLIKLGFWNDQTIMEFFKDCQYTYTKTGNNEIDFTDKIFTCIDEIKSKYGNIGDRELFMYALGFVLVKNEVKDFSKEVI